MWRGRALINLNLNSTDCCFLLAWLLTCPPTPKLPASLSRNKWLNVCSNLHSTKKFLVKVSIRVSSPSNVPDKFNSLRKLRRCSHAKARRPSFSAANIYPQLKFIPMQLWVTIEILKLLIAARNVNSTLDCLHRNCIANNPQPTLKWFCQFDRLLRDRFRSWKLHDLLFSFRPTKTHFANILLRKKWQSEEEMWCDVRASFQLSSLNEKSFFKTEEF